MRLLGLRTVQDLLRPPEARGGVDRAAGVDGARLDWPPTRDFGDTMSRNLVNSKQVKGSEQSAPRR